MDFLTLVGLCFDLLVPSCGNLSGSPKGSSSFAEVGTALGFNPTTMLCLRLSLSAFFSGSSVGCKVPALTAALYSACQSSMTFSKVILPFPSLVFSFQDPIALLIFVESHWVTTSRQAFSSRSGTLAKANQHIPPPLIRCTTAQSPSSFGPFFFFGTVEPFTTKHSSFGSASIHQGSSPVLYLLQSPDQCPLYRTTWSRLPILLGPLLLLLWLGLCLQLVQPLLQGLFLQALLPFLQQGRDVLSH